MMRGRVHIHIESAKDEADSSSVVKVIVKIATATLPHDHEALTFEVRSDLTLSWNWATAERECDFAVSSKDGPDRAPPQRIEYKYGSGDFS
jgi:hypothetical protein